MHGISDNMPPGYDGMSPANQGLANQFDGAGTDGNTSGAMSKPYAAQQPELAAVHAAQNDNLNMQGQRVYLNNESRAASNQELLQMSELFCDFQSLCFSTAFLLTVSSLYRFPYPSL